MVHDEVGVDARILALVFIYEEELETDRSAVTALIAADGDEFETGAGANDVDQAAAGVIDAEVLRIDIGGQGGDEGVVADVGPTGGAIVEGEKVAVALENILPVGQGGVGGEAVDVADLHALALPVNEPGDEHGAE